jgi:hypothetical protein
MGIAAPDEAPERVGVGGQERLIDGTEAVDEEGLGIGVI